MQGIIMLLGFASENNLTTEFFFFSLDELKIIEHNTTLLFNNRRIHNK